MARQLAAKAPSYAFVKQHAHELGLGRRPAEGPLLRVPDNMPGALVYTDPDLNIVVCNDRFREKYPVPEELLQPGRPNPEFLRYLAPHGYCGKGEARGESA